MTCELCYPADGCENCDHVTCPECGARLTVERAGGRFYLMRLAEVEETDCLRCSRVTELMRDDDGGD